MLKGALKTGVSDVWDAFDMSRTARARLRHFILAHAPSEGLILRLWQTYGVQGWQGLPQNEAGTERMWARLLESKWVSARLVPELLYSMCEKCLPFSGQEAGIKDHPAYAFVTGHTCDYAGRDWDKLAAEASREVVRTMMARLYLSMLKTEKARQEAAGSAAGSAAGGEPPTA
jgi:hypothetical protein